MKTLKHPIHLLGAVMLVLLTSCSSDDNEPQGSNIDPTILVDYTKIHTWLKGDVKGFIAQSGIDVPSEAIAYDVDIYDVVYKTPYKGEMIEASGRVLVPVTTETVSTACFSHGTIGADADAMTNIRAGSNTTILLSGLASFGMVTVAPDLIGFGSSVELYHPYYVYEPTATATINNLLAAKLLAEELGIQTDKELYLAGYSQGGYTTMSTHKYIEENGIDFFDLKASFPASGGYFIKGVQDYFFARDVYQQPFYLAYVANAYHDYYDWGSTYPLTLFFNEPYASSIPDLLDGSLSNGEINAMLNDTVAVLVNNDFLTDPTGPDYQFLIDMYDDNSPIGWVPKNAVFMYHGSGDTTVPYQNSVDVYDQFLEAGATTVSFTTIDGGTHATGVGPYLEGLLGHIIEMEDE
ncbi:MAG: hypothetical protein ABJG41_03355 [Cyclobacteriaceae bacterium]